MLYCLSVLFLLIFSTTVVYSKIEEKHEELVHHLENQLLQEHKRQIFDHLKGEHKEISRRLDSLDQLKEEQGQMLQRLESLEMILLDIKSRL